MPTAPMPKVPMKPGASSTLGRFSRVFGPWKNERKKETTASLQKNYWILRIDLEGIQTCVTALSVKSSMHTVRFAFANSEIQCPVTLFGEISSVTFPEVL